MKVLLADDHAVVREGLRVLLESRSWITVIGEASDGREALRMAQETCPDVVVMDIAMPNLNGIEATKQLATACPRTKVVILSVYSTTEHIHQAFKAGACGYVLKESAGKELIDALRDAHFRKHYLSNNIREVHPELLANIDNILSPLERLSKREREILQLVVEGKSSQAIAEMLAISPKTVETYRSRLMQKLHISDLPALVKFAVQHGLTPP